MNPSLLSLLPPANHTSILNSNLTFSFSVEGLDRTEDWRTFWKLLPVVICLCILVACLYDMIFAIVPRGSGVGGQGQAGFTAASMGGDRDRGGGYHTLHSVSGPSRGGWWKSVCAACPFPFPCLPSPFLPTLLPAGPILGGRDSGHLTFPVTFCWGGRRASTHSASATLVQTFSVPPQP